MRRDRWFSCVMVFVATFLLTDAFKTDSSAQGDKKLPPEIPKEFQGRWLLKSTSVDNGKSSKEADGNPICIVSATKIKFTRKVDFSTQELTPIAVIKVKDDRGAPGYMIAFSNGKIWGVSKKGGEKSVGVVIHDVIDKKPRETFRMVVHIEPLKMTRAVWEYEGGAFSSKLQDGQWVE